MYVQQPPGSIEDVLPPPGPPPGHRPSMENSSWTDEPATSAWEDVAPQHVAPQHAAAAGATPSSIHRKEVPASLRPGGGGIDVGFGSPEEEDSVWNEARKQPSELSLPSQIPDALRPGVQRSETNPFLKNRAPSDSNLHAVPASLQPPIASLSHISLDETGTNNPWKPTIAVQPPIQGNEPPVVIAPGDSEPDPWARSTPEPPAKVPISPKSPDLISLRSRSSTWDEDSHSERDEKGSPSQKPAMPDDLEREQHVWDDLGSSDVAKGKGKVPELTAAQAPQLDDWSLIDSDPSLSPPPRQPQEELSTAVLEEKPALPPRATEGRVKWVPSRPPVDGKAETYQVKNIRWHDPNSSNNPRVSPILIQNENGPCPLVALVNALTMTTPDDIPDTVLVQVLRSREQVSLSLLLDAVFDELMSPRRTSSEDSLPDVAELYSFLQSLHTGMNVNPRFIPTPEVITAYEHTSLTQLHLLERHKYIPGTFEDTAEMSLYATFSIPLVHGWLPPYDDAVCASMQRHATSYEDVQNLLFREEELEDKLATSEEGLTEAEQDLYQDIITIKIFLNESATQLTPWGIEVIQKAIRPGTFAILFRNDHFSTLYCHPQTQQLLTLVTDAGYRSHDEIVWESLVDVNGELNQFMSGDYRLVSGDNTAELSTGAGKRHSDQGSGNWTTVTNKRGKTKETGPIEEQGQASSSTEQEDRDLALAMQLQEEEDQKHREEQARRQRERALSEQYIEQAHLPIPVTRPVGNSGGNTGGNSTSRRSPAAGPSSSTPVPPPRRSSNSVSNSANNSTSALPASTSQRSLPARAPTSQTVRPLVPPPRPGVNRPVSSDEPPPPSYEQAAQVPAYVPPPGHPNHHESSPTASRQASRTSNGVGSPAPVRGRRTNASVPANRRPAVASGGSSSKSDRDCIVM
ncbi:hypothetical protein M441DRAFT_59006 [Trichoderma asperellum CBS 433.97]|uniref:MINDY deubiquitinase domain-containing protein n=1 Tax=Trichoderma asperellum (strain ATCC 204424 / CBS 433.97 / NBRC 101777) TaxID=1042311 RepID=A0A2T3Z5X3_TRIA4|nr:hypothetical protein M441DRAFT_59006 [Trichoderma asperellum CBS 433.97]PTB40195.1 hypothetical protein M441DRAFT_59006 [Trichoderma asperellum CBS 433.97]